MDSWQYIGPYVFWIFLAVIIVGGNFFDYLKSRSRDSAIREVAQRGQPVPAEMFSLLPRTSQHGLLVAGLVMIFIGIGLAVVAWSTANTPQTPLGTESALVGLLPGLIGFALLISHFSLARSKDEAR